MLTLMYITNQPDIAKIAQNAGVDRIFIDMEYIGKDERQGGMDTVQNHHTVEDVKNIRKVLDKSELLVRVNPIHAHSQSEIESVIHAGADIIMLPMWKSADDVKMFLNFVNGRCKTMLLLENKQAAACIGEVLLMNGIDEIHIGLNDLHLSMGRTFLFQLLADGTVERITKKIRESGIPFGFGGFGKLGDGLLNADYIMAEHYRLGSSMAILSRAFCDTKKITDKNEIKTIFDNGVNAVRAFEDYLSVQDAYYFEQSHKKLCTCIDEIVRRKSGSISHLTDFAAL